MDETSQREGNGALTAYVKWETADLQKYFDENWIVKDKSPEAQQKFDSICDELRRRDDAPSFLEIDKKGKAVVLIDAVAKYLNEKYTFKTIYHKTGEEVYVYEKGMYVGKGREIIKTRTEGLLGENAKNRVVEEIFGKIKRQTAGDPKDFEKVDINLIPFENIIYDLKNKVIIEFDPKYQFIFKIPHKYDAVATCPKWISFIEDTLSPNDIPVMQEWFGFCLYRRYFIKKGMILVGPPDTGKTITMNVLNRWVGLQNTAGLSLEEINAENSFDMKDLYYKLVNSKDELKSNDLKNINGFKMATGGSIINAEEKFGDRFRFLTFAKCIYACNRVPSPGEKDIDDEAYFGRWLPIEFVNVVEKEDINTGLENELCEEFSGITNWALEGLDRLLKNSKFSYNKTAEEIRNIMERNGDDLACFAQDSLIMDPNGKITVEQLHHVYTLYANYKKITPMSKRGIGSNIQKFAIYMKKGHKQNNYWLGVSFNNEFISTYIKDWPKVTNVDIVDTFLKTMRTFPKGKIEHIEGNKTLDIISPEVSTSTTEEPFDELKYHLNEKQHEGLSSGENNNISICEYCGNRAVCHKDNNSRYACFDCINTQPGSVSDVSLPVETGSSEPVDSHFDHDPGSDATEPGYIYEDE